MRIRFACPQCEATVATEDVTPPLEVPCPSCGAKGVFSGTTEPGAPIQRCLSCAGPHMFLQREFPRRIGLAMTAAGALLFLVLMGQERVALGFGVLLGVALLDALLYRAAPVMTVCYHCQTEFRRAPVNPLHRAYDPKIAFYTAAQRASRIRGERPPQARE